MFVCGIFWQVFRRGWAETKTGFYLSSSQEKFFLPEKKALDKGWRPPHELEISTFSFGILGIKSKTRKLHSTPFQNPAGVPSAGWNRAGGGGEWGKGGRGREQENTSSFQYKEKKMINNRIHKIPLLIVMQPVSWWLCSLTTLIHLLRSPLPSSS